MTDPTTAAPLTDDEEAQRAALNARAAAAAQAQKDAESDALKALVASDTFKAAVDAFAATIKIASEDIELTYALRMMRTLADRYAA